MIFRLDCEIDGDQYVLLTQWVDGVPVGTLSLQGKGTICASISRLFVEPPHRRQGVAIGLMISAERIARNEFNSESINLVVKPNNDVARRLYKQLGYIVGYAYDDGDYLMCKAL